MEDTENLGLNALSCVVYSVIAIVLFLSSPAHPSTMRLSYWGVTKELRRCQCIVISNKHKMCALSQFSEEVRGNEEKWQIVHAVTGNWFQILARTFKKELSHFWANDILEANLLLPQRLMSASLPPFFKPR